MANNKNQHYVPQFILRNFGSDGTHISVVRLKDWRVIPDIPKVKGQCQEDYFYGRDLLIEKSFAKEEGKVSRLLGDMKPKTLAALLAVPEAVHQLRLFTMYQHARTPGAGEHLSRLVVEMGKTTLKEQIRINAENGTPMEMSIEDVEDAELAVEDPHMQSIYQCMRQTPIVSDLALAFIFTERSPGFVTSDHPVAVYNQFIEGSGGQFRGGGLATRGVQIFMPLSPGVTLAMYDPVAYEYVGNAGICRARADDVVSLNRMQAVGGLSCVFYRSDRMNKAGLDDLKTARRKHVSLYRKTVTPGPFVRTDENQATQRVEFMHQQLRLGARMSFVRQFPRFDFAMDPQMRVPVRSPDLLDVAQQYGRYLDRRAQRAQGAP